MQDVHARIEELEGTVETAQSVLAKADRVLSVADELQQRSRHLMTAAVVILAVGATAVVGLALLHRRSP